MTPAEAAAYELRAEHERVNKRILQHEAILSARADCKTNNMVWIIDGASHFDRLRMERDPTWLPKHANLLGFSCMTGGDFRRMMRGIY